MVQVATSLLAGKQLGQKPGLHSKVKRVLAGLVDTAIEARKLHGDAIPIEGPLAARVDGHVIYYSLTLDPLTVTILVVEPASEIS